MDEDCEAGPSPHPVAPVNDTDDEFFNEEAESSDSEAGCHSLQPMQPPSHDTENDAPSPQDEDSIVGSGIADIPNDLETCLAMNKAYQDILLDAIDKCYLALEQNREMQANAPKVLAERSRVALTRLPSPPNTFLYPYFRDKRGMPAPPNEDEKIKRANNEACPYLRPPPPWTTEEIATLRHGVHCSLVQRAVESCMNRKEILAEKLVVQRNPELEKRVREIEADIEEIRQLNIRELIKRVNRPPDWLRISAVDFEGTRNDLSCELMWKHMLQTELSQERWTSEENARLKETAEKWQACNWEEIAKELMSGRSAFQCAQHYHSKLVNRIRSGPFTKEEDDLLLRLVEVCRDGDNIPWRQVTYYMENRSRGQLISRWERALRPSLKRGKWTPEEDLILLTAVKLHGTSEWNKIGAALPNRPLQACRERYNDHYKMELVFGSFTPEEDALLLDLVEKHGPKWARIAQSMPWRTDNTILNRYKKLARVLNLESTDQVAEKKHKLPLLNVGRKHYTAQSRRKDLLASVKQKVMCRRQQQQARRVVLDQDMEHAEYYSLYSALLRQKDARITKKQNQTNRGRALNAAISRFLGVQTVVCSKQRWRAYEYEENSGILSVLRKAHDLPPEEEQLESGPESLFAKHFQRQILGWETEIPTCPLPVLPPNMTTTATYSHLFDLVKHLKIPEHMDDSELANALSQKSTGAVLCCICRLRNEARATPTTCLQCRRLRQIYEHYEVLRGHFLSYFLWAAILSSQPIEKPPPEQRGRPNRRKSDHLKLRKCARKNPWVAEKWRQHREAKKRAAAEAQAQGSNPTPSQHQDDQENDEQDQDEPGSQFRHDVQNNVDHEICDELNEEIEGKTYNENSGDTNQSAEESTSPNGHAESNSVEVPMIIG